MNTETLEKNTAQHY